MCSVHTENKKYLASIASREDIRRAIGICAVDDETRDILMDIYYRRKSRDYVADIHAVSDSTRYRRERDGVNKLCEILKS